MSMIRRINLYAGPSSGKSATAGWLSQQMKKFRSPRIVTDWVQEVCKWWVYLDRPPTGYSDQNSIFSQQLGLEEVALRKCETIVCDAPLLMNCYYGWKYNRPFYDLNVTAAKRFEADFPSVNIFLRRGDLEYEPTGRFQTEAEAKAMDDEVFGFVAENLGDDDLYEFKTTDENGILEFVKSWIQK